MAIRLTIILKILFLSVLFIFSCTENKTISTNQLNNSIDSLLNRDKEWLKKYAFCVCTLEGYRREGITISDYSYGVYKNISLYDVKHYEVIDSIVRKNVENAKPLQYYDNDKVPVLKNCIEFYESRLLDSVVNSFDEEKKVIIEGDLQTQNASEKM